MSGFKCPYCSQLFTINENVNYCETAIYLNQGWATINPRGNPGLFTLLSLRCPNNECNGGTFILVGSAESDFAGIRKQLLPEYSRTQPPPCVPEHIQKDYLEASSIVELSPKASATLARQCLQSMIHDFWGITKTNLHQEIVALKGKIDDEVVDALLAVKSIGNIGAHPEKDSNINTILDVEPDEAGLLLDIIEYLIEDWYVARDKKKGLFAHLREARESKIKD